MLLGLLLAAFAAFSFAQQTTGEITDRERIAQLEKQFGEMQRMLGAFTGNGALETTPATLEMRLARIEMRLDRLEQQVVRSSSSAGVSPDRMMESRLRTLENAVMRPQQR